MVVKGLGPGYSVVLVVAQAFTRSNYPRPRWPLVWPLSLANIPACLGST